MQAERVPAATAARSVEVGLCTSGAGRQAICVFIKRTYELVSGRRMQRSARAEFKLRAAPVDEDGEGHEPVACPVGECDLVPFKPCTDVVVHGHVRAPGNRAIAGMTAALRVGGHRKQVQVVGDRRVAWRPGSRPQFERPEPFVALPVSWRRAFGGIDASVPIAPPSNLFELFSALEPELHPGAYPPNPAGTGWVVNAGPRVLCGLRLPNFECPGNPLSPDRLVHGSPNDWVWAPQPAGFGWVAQTWFPRSTLLGASPDHGSLPEHLRCGWLAVPPSADAGPDPRFFCGAPAGQRLFGLRGDEPVELHGFAAAGPVISALPGDSPEVVITFRRRALAVTPRLHAIELFPDDALASILWVMTAESPQQLPVNLPGAELDGYDLLDGVDVILDGVALSS